MKTNQICIFDSLKMFNENLPKLYTDIAIFISLIIY